MKHAEADYINAGYVYEKADTPNKARAVADNIRRMIQSEALEDQADARYLVNRGREEARQETSNV